MSPSQPLLITCKSHRLARNSLCPAVLRDQNNASASLKPSSLHSPRTTKKGGVKQQGGRGCFGFETRVRGLVTVHSCPVPHHDGTRVSSGPLGGITPLPARPKQKPRDDNVRHAIIGPCLTQSNFLSHYVHRANVHFINKNTVHVHYTTVCLVYYDEIFEDEHALLYLHLEYLDPNIRRSPDRPAARLISTVREIGRCNIRFTASRWFLFRSYLFLSERLRLGAQVQYA